MVTFLCYVFYILFIIDTKEREIPEIAPAPKEVEEGVPEAPRFIETLQQHIDVIEGTPVTLQCVTVGQPTVTWYQVRAHNSQQERKNNFLYNCYINYT